MKLQTAADNKITDITINIEEIENSSTDLKSEWNFHTNDMWHMKISYVLAKLWAPQFQTLCPHPTPAPLPDLNCHATKIPIWYVTMPVKMVQIHLEKGATNLLLTAPVVNSFLFLHWNLIDHA